MSPGGLARSRDPVASNVGYEHGAVRKRDGVPFAKVVRLIAKGAFGAVYETVDGGRRSGKAARNMARHKANLGRGGRGEERRGGNEASRRRHAHWRRRGASPDMM